MWLVLATAEKHGIDLWTVLLKAHPISKVVFSLLIICSVLSIAVIIERWIVLKRTQKATADALQQLDSWMSNQQWDEARAAIGHATRERMPVFAVLRAGVAYWQELVAVGETRLEVMEAMVSEAVRRELKLVRSGLRANLPILANIASVAPFIGLFGTVVGIILTFDAIAQKGNMGPELVASGIADALIATAMGLFAAIPALIAYNFFVDHIGQVLLTMEEAVMEHIYFLVQREQTTGELPAQAEGADLAATIVNA